MSHVCAKCSNDPTSYSFKRVSEKNHVTTFYSNPAKAQIFKDHEDIVEHFRHSLARLPKDRHWTWIFDGEGFDTDHLVEIDAGKRIIYLITETHGHTLQEVKIINPSIHLKVILKVILPFLSDTIRSKVKVMEDRIYSVLEFV